MSIATQLTALANNKAAIKAAIEAKNPSVAPTDALAQWPDSIASISGTPEGNWWLVPYNDPITAEEGWPKLNEIVDAIDTTHPAAADYAQKVGYLVGRQSASTAIYVATGEYLVFSDGATYAAAGNVTYTHAWNDATADPGHPDRWVVVCSNLDFCRSVPDCTYVYWVTGGKAFRETQPKVNVGSYANNRSGNPFRNRQMLRHIENVKCLAGNSLANAFDSSRNLVSFENCTWDLSACTSLQSAFYNCQSLTSLDVSGWDLSACTSLQNAFYYCQSLTSLDVSGWDLSACTSLQAAFYNCQSLTSLDVSGWDLSACTSLQGAFYSCTSLTSLDTSGWDLSKVTSMNEAFQGNTYVLTYAPAGTTKPLDFSACTNFTRLVSSSRCVFFPPFTNVRPGLSVELNSPPLSRDCVCTFAQDGTTPTGGIAYHLNDLTGEAASTLRLSGTTKNYFTAAERSAIEAYLSAKNWTLAW